MSYSQFSIYSAVLGGANLRHVEEVTIDPKIEQSAVPAGGSVFNVDMFAAKQETEFTLKTHDLTAILATLGISPIYGLSLPSVQPSYFQYRLRTIDGYASGSNHGRMKSFAGYVAIENIEATQDDKKLASAALKYHCLADASGNYLGFQSSQALISSPAMTDAGFVLGPLYIDVASVATQIAGNTKARFESGNQFKVSRAAGALVGSQGAVEKIEPKLSFSTMELLDLGVFGTSLAAVTNVTQYFQAVDSDGRRVAPGTPSHFSISFPTAKLEPNKVSGGNDQSDAMLDYVAHCIGETVTLTLGVALP